MSSGHDEHEALAIARLEDETDEDYLRRCAVWALDASTLDGEVRRDDAAHLLEQAARQSPDLLRVITERVLARECWEIVRYHVRYVRSDAWQRMVAEGKRIMRESVDVDALPPSADDSSAAPRARIALLPSEEHAPTPNTAMYGGMGKSVLDTYLLPGHEPGQSIALGDARKSDLRAAIVAAEARVRGNLKHILLWRRIAERLPDEETRVRAVVSEDEVALYSVEANALAAALPTLPPAVNE